MGIPLCAPVGTPGPAAFPEGQHHAWNTGLQPRPHQRAQRSYWLRGKAVEGRSSGEQHGNATGKGTLQGDGSALGWETGAWLRQWLVHTQNHLSVARSTGKRWCEGGIGPRGGLEQGWGLMPLGISPAARSEIAWINKHDSCWETQGLGQGQHSSSLLCTSCGEERKREKALGLLFLRLVGAGSGWGCPAVTTAWPLSGS